MRFDRSTAERIASGRKTRHTVPRVEREPAPARRDDTVTLRDMGTGKVTGKVPGSEFGRRHPQAPCQPGDLVPITVMRANPDMGYRRGTEALADRTPRREGERVCRVNVLSVEPALLHEIDQRQAMAEGYKTTDDFHAAWWDRHRDGCGKPGQAGYPRLVPVWVIVWELNTEQPVRLLAKASDANRGYTESTTEAVDEAGEAPEDEHLDRYSQESQQDKLRRTLDAEMRVKERSLEDRTAAVREAAKESGIDLSRQLRRIESAVSEAENKVARLGKPPKKTNGHQEAA